MCGTSYKLTLIAPMTDYCLRSNVFKWTKEDDKSFRAIKKRTEALVLALPDFDKIFEVNCDASNIGIKDVLSHERMPRQRYSTYD